eukprot:3809924-Rhodomonas_salina.1
MGERKKWQGGGGVEGKETRGRRCRRRGMRLRAWQQHSPYQYQTLPRASVAPSSTSYWTSRKPGRYAPEEEKVQALEDNVQLVPGSRAPDLSTAHRRANTVWD